MKGLIVFWVCISWSNFLQASWDAKWRSTLSITLCDVKVLPNRTSRHRGSLVDIIICGVTYVSHMWDLIHILHYFISCLLFMIFCVFWMTNFCFVFEVDKLFFFFWGVLKPHLVASVLYVFWREKEMHSWVAFGCWIYYLKVLNGHLWYQP